MSLLKTLGLSSTLLLSTVAHAKNVTYDLTNLYSSPGQVRYDRLDFYRTSSAVMNVARTVGQNEPTITSLTINFPDIAKLTATNFKKTPHGTYRAIVSGAWVFKEVFVDIDDTNFEIDRPIHIRVSVSERTALINPTTEVQGPVLFETMGNIHDITPTRVVDNANTMLSDKKVILSLRDRMGVDDKGRFGFIISTLWYGKGTKNIAFPFGTPYDIENMEAVGLVVDSTNPFDTMIAVKYQDRNGYQMLSPAVSLRSLIEPAFL